MNRTPAVRDDVFFFFCWLAGWPGPLEFRVGTFEAKSLSSSGNSENKIIPDNLKKRVQGSFDG